MNKKLNERDQMKAMADWLSPDNPLLSGKKFTNKTFDKFVKQAVELGLTSKPPKKRKNGFTVVELLIILAIIGLLAVVAIPNFIKARDGYVDPRTYVKVNGTTMEIVTIDGCQYIDNYSGNLCHKGNCTNTIHMR